MDCSSQDLGPAVSPGMSKADLKEVLDAPAFEDPRRSLGDFLRAEIKDSRNVQEMFFWFVVTQFSSGYCF